MIWVGRFVIVVDDSSLVMARLLKDLVEMMSDSDDGLGLLQASNLVRAISAQVGAAAGAGAGAEEKKKQSKLLLNNRIPLPSKRNMNVTTRAVFGVGKNDNNNNAREHG
jgi:hypothetical protein